MRKHMTLVILSVLVTTILLTEVSTQSMTNAHKVVAGPGSASNGVAGGLAAGGTTGDQGGIADLGNGTSTNGQNGVNGHASNGANGHTSIGNSGKNPSAASGDNSDNS
jgi:hypothetical protein